LYSSYDYPQDNPLKGMSVITTQQNKKQSGNLSIKDCQVVFQPVKQQISAALSFPKLRHQMLWKSTPAHLKRP
jgi:hypothetical protein